MSAASIERTPWSLQAAMTGFLVMGYLAMSRSFAHLGLGSLFIGELALGALIITRPQAFIRPWLGSLMRPNSFSPMACCFYVFIAYGVLQCLRGVFYHDPIYSLQCVVFHAYALFFFVGLWVGRNHQHFLPKLMLATAWVHGLYGVLYIAVFSPLGLTDGIADVDPDYVGMFGAPRGATWVLLGLLAFYGGNFRKIWIPFLLNAFVLLGMQVRAEWLALAACLMVWSVLTGRVLTMMKIAGGIAVLLAIGWVTDVSIPAPKTRGGEISTRHIVGRTIASFDTQAARKYIDNADVYKGTTEWRLEWWSAISKEVHERPGTAAFGLGYGYPLWDLHPDDLGTPIRSPHNIAMFVLGYTGWLGLAIFALFNLSLLWLLWKTYRLTGQPFGLCLWTLVMAWSVFDNYLEGPFGGIPFYLLIGVSVAPLFVSNRDDNVSGDLPTRKSGDDES